jgi:hypothetical protein
MATTTSIVAQTQSSVAGTPPENALLSLAALEALIDADPQTVSANLTFADAVNIIVNATTGTKIATAVTQKLGFWNAAPVVQPTSASQATVTQGQTTLTDNTGGAVSTTLASITAGAAYAQADATATKNAIASLAAELALVKTDVANLITLAHAIRTGLVNTGIIKGS